MRKPHESECRARCPTGADELIITIEDDGVGGADPIPGTGLTGLRDRIEASYGTISIESPAQQGTRIVARVPITGASGHPGLNG